MSFLFYFLLPRPIHGPATDPDEGCVPLPDRDAVVFYPAVPTELLPEDVIDTLGTNFQLVEHGAWFPKSDIQPGSHVRAVANNETRFRIGLNYRGNA